MFKKNIALMMALLLALLVVMPASATPPQPAGFYGTVMIDGSNAPDGTSVTAWIDGTQYAQTDSFTYNGASVYAFDVPGDDPDTPEVEGGVAGDTIVFQVAGQEAAQSATWAEGSNGELNLTANAPAPTPTSTPMPPTPTPQRTATPPPDGSVNLALEPANITTNLAQSFDITIMAHAGSQEVDGVSAYINFDPTIMEVVSITPSNTFSTILQNEFDNTTGQVNFAAGTFFEPFPTGSLTVATITFSALTPTDNSVLDFNTSLPRRSDVTFENGNSVLGSTTGNSVSVNNPSTILGSVEWEGRHDAPPPHERWSMPISVTLTLPGESEPQYSFSTSTDEHGDFSLAAIDAGTYNIGVKGLHTLGNVLTIDLAGGENTIDFGLLREGDANNDNVVSILDFSILASTFAKCAGTAGFDERADFDEDSCVTIRDFSLLASNFGEAGDGGTTSMAPRSTDNGVQLLMDAPSSTVALDETFNLTVQVEAGEQLIDGTQLALNFDAAYLQVQSISASETLPLELLNQIDNQRGQINFAAGILPAEDGTTSFPSGTISLLEIEFKAKAATEGNGTALSFQFSAPEATDVTFGGTSVLGEHNDATIEISNNPTAITTGEFQASPEPTWLLGVLALMLLAGALLVRRKWLNA